ncbi:MAG: DUF2927 domain-containing protein, partial [Pseudomonadota bacterium]
MAAALLGFAALAGCGATTDVSQRADASLPEMKQFPPSTATRGVARSNSDIYQEFLDLTFNLESGQNLTRMTRFEGPVRVTLTGRHGPTVGRDLDLLLERLRDEAGIAISRTDD